MDAAQRQLEAVHVGQNPLQQTALDVWSSEQHNKARLLAMHPLPLDEMLELSSVPVPNNAELNEDHERGSGHGTLSLLYSPHLHLECRLCILRSSCVE